MAYQIEVLNEHGQMIGYVWRGRLRKYPGWYPHPSNAQKGADAFLYHNPDCQCFIKPFKRIS